MFSSCPKSHFPEKEPGLLGEVTDSRSGAAKVSNEPGPTFSAKKIRNCSKNEGTHQMKAGVRLKGSYWPNLKQISIKKDNDLLT